MLTNEERIEAQIWLAEAMDEDIVASPIQAGDFTQLDWALVYEATPQRRREDVWALIPESMKSAVLAEMRPDVRQLTLESLPPKQIMALAKNSSSADIIEYYDLLPEKIARGFLKKLSAVDKEQLTSALSYEDTELGRYVTHDALVVINTAVLADVILDLKNLDDKYYTDKIYVVDEFDHLQGSFAMHLLATQPKKQKIAAIMDTDIATLAANMELPDAVNALKSSEESHLPVLDSHGCLLGVFGQSEALTFTQQNFEEQLAHSGNVSDEDLFAPIFKSSRSRAVWLGVNLLTAFLASSVIGLFEDVIAQVVALAILMPIVASMGGIAGSQTLTLTIRGLATGQLNNANTWALGRKELAVSLLNGLLWALVVGVSCALWFQDVSLAGIIALAILLNMLIAVMAGILIPLLLDRMGIDPALAGSVILTTVSDVVGFFVFLGSAALLLV